MKSNKKLFLALTLIIISALAATSISYAFWLSSVNTPADKDSNITVTIGEGEAATTTIDLLDQTGTATGLSPTNQLTITVPVQWKSENTDASDYTGTLSVEVDTATGIKIDSSTTYASLITANPATGQTITLNGSAVNVTVTVSLASPTQAQFDAIAGKSVTIPLIFKVTSPTAPVTGG